MKRYPKYKDSGIEWIGEIPVGWISTKIGRLTYLGRGRVISNIEIADNSGTYPVYSSQTANSGILGYINSFDFEGDYVTWTTDGANAGTVFFRNGKFNCTNVCGTMIPKGENNIYLPYIPYLLNLGTKYHVRYDINPKLMNAEMAQIDICLPTFSEQQLIANYLDHKTHQIDTLLEGKQQQIEILKEQRTAIINHAVTKGLNPNIKMKDSGTEWLGEIPSHWKIIKLKYLFNFVSGGTPPTENLSYWDGNIPWISPKDMKKEVIDDSKDKITQSAIDDNTTSVIPEKSVLIVVRSGILRRKIPVAINSRAVTINQDLKGLIPDKSIIDSNYFIFIVLGNQEALSTKWLKQMATVESLEYPYIANTKIPVPPIQEQEKIVKHIINKISEIDYMLEKNSNIILKLEEYRTTLISDAVTGKIDVRDEVPS